MNDPGSRTRRLPRLRGEAQSLENKNGLGPNSQILTLRIVRAAFLPERAPYTTPGAFLDFISRGSIR